MKSFDYFKNYCGGELLKSKLSSLIYSGKMPTSLILSAEEGFGKNLFARNIAEAYLEDRQEGVTRGVNPDCVIVSGTGLSSNITVESVRNACFEMYKSSTAENGRRVCIIEDVKNLNPRSSAALLKTLEDPPERVIFILTASSGKDTLSTISSRCVEFRIDKPSIEESIGFIGRIFPEIENKKIRAELLFFRGRIGQVIRLFEDEDFRAMKELAERFSAHCNDNMILPAMSDLSRLTDRKEMNEFLEIAILSMYSNHLMSDPGRISGLIDVISEMKRDLIQKNVNLNLFGTELSRRLMEKNENSRG